MGYWFMYATSAYVATSLLFFCFPTILRSKKKYNYDLFNQVIEKKKIMRISHRGGPRLTT